MAEKVFISYSHQDSACAHGIARYLKRHGCEVWIDSQNLALGEQWADSIENALQEANITLAILSSSSLRRDQVLKEIAFSLKRMEEEGTDDFRVFFVVIGQIHPSWFKEDERVEKIKRYLTKYQYVELSAYGEVTIEAMEKLLGAIRGKGIEEGSADFSEERSLNGFINQNSLPEETRDEISGCLFYKTYSADLSSSTVFPFALDNQWLPEIFQDQDNDLSKEFEKEGFCSQQVRDFLKTFRQKNFELAFFNNRQVIVKLNTILYDPYFQELLLNDINDKAAFKKLLGDGSVTILLNNDQMTPFVRLKREDSHQKLVDAAWNNLCEEIPVYCIRENWSSASDPHSMDFLRFCSNMAMDHSANVHLARALHLNDGDIGPFLITLKSVSMQTFCQTHMNGTQAQDKVDDYSRSLFYRNYIVKNDGSDPEGSVYRCLYDKKKPYTRQLKRLIDIYYNSALCNNLQCGGLLPGDTRPENLYLHSLYLSSGDKEVSIEELQYAFSEFFLNCSILDEIENIGSELYLENWDLEKIAGFRFTEAWYEYTELLELISRRSNQWKVDFNEIELLLQRFLKCFDREKDRTDEEDIAFTFRVMVGSKVLDIVKTNDASKAKEYGGSYADPGRIPLKVSFCIGDLTRKERKELVFQPFVFFDGRIDTDDADGFFNKLKEFICSQCGFQLIKD